ALLRRARMHHERKEPGLLQRGRDPPRDHLDVRTVKFVKIHGVGNLSPRFLQFIAKWASERATPAISRAPGADQRMAKPIHGLLDSLIEQFASAIASRAEQMFARSAAGRAAGRPNGVRLCANPGCKNPGAGPRNRWFCREH